ncbi:hypothetical protein AJOOGB_AJOOGB_14795, partial [Dysosmobacter welbionis]
RPTWTAPSTARPWASAAPPPWTLWGCTTSWRPTTPSSGTGSRRRTPPGRRPCRPRCTCPLPMAWRSRGRSSTSTAPATGCPLRCSAMRRCTL